MRSSQVSVAVFSDAVLLFGIVVVVVAGAGALVCGASPFIRSFVHSSIRPLHPFIHPSSGRLGDSASL